MYKTIFVLYLISYFQISPAVEFSVTRRNQITAKQNENSRETVSAASRGLARQERAIFSFLIAVATSIVTYSISKLIGDEVVKVVKRAIRGKRALGYNYDIINSNYDEAVKLKQRISAINPVAGDAIYVKRTGFQCDSNFCKQKSVGWYAMGICSPYSCYCDHSNNNNGIVKCPSGQVFDPVCNCCNYIATAAFCGNG